MIECPYTVRNCKIELTSRKRTNLLDNVALATIQRVEADKIILNYCTGRLNPRGPVLVEIGSRGHYKMVRPTSMVCKSEYDIEFVVDRTNDDFKELKEMYRRLET